MAGETATKAPNPDDLKTTGAVPAPGSPEGQAGGSPPPKTGPTSGGDEGTEDVKALRRRLTEQAEELKTAKKAAQILEAAMSKPGWKAVEADLLGNPVEPETDLDKEVFGDNVELGKRWKEKILAEGEARALRRLQPMVSEVMLSKDQRALERALKTQGLPDDTIDSEAFQTFSIPRRSWIITECR